MNIIRYARGRLGTIWGLDRPLHYSELAEVLRLAGRNPGDTVRSYERGHRQASGPVLLAIDMMIAGARPPGLELLLREWNP
jgi:hypothetical protein